MFLVQGRGETAVMSAVTAVLLHKVVMDKGQSVILLVQRRGEVAFTSTFTSVPLHISVVGTGTDCSIVGTG